MSSDRAAQAWRFVAQPLVWSGAVVILGAIVVLSDSSLTSTARAVADVAFSLGVFFWVAAAAKMLWDKAAR